MSRRADDHCECAAVCTFSAFMGALAGGLIAALLMSGVMMLGGGA